MEGNRPVAFAGGHVLTMDPRHPRADVVIVRGDRIEAVGDEGLLAAHPEAQVVDLGGRTLAPGLIDAHRHVSMMALHPRFADLSHCTSTDEVQRALQAHAELVPTGEWLCGVGWRHPEDLCARDLDQLDFGRPILLAHYSLHRCLVSSHGLDALGIGPGTPDPVGGRIEHDGNGRPNGVLVERAWGQAGAAAYAEHRDPDRWADHIEAHAATLLSEGITAVHDAACSPAAEAAYALLASRGRLPVSVLAFPHPAALMATPDHERLEGPPTGEGDEWFRIGPIKLFADGGTDMAVDAERHGRRRVRGIRLDDVVAAGERSIRHGFDLAIHAMGNAGVTLACETIERASRAVPDVDHRPRVEHVTLATEAELGRLSSVGAVAVVQPGLLPVMGPGIHHVHWDEAKWFPFRTAVRLGIRLAASTDAPCAAGSPLQATQHGVTRSDLVGTLEPDEALDYGTWLHAWTAGAAYAGRQEHERGMIRPGLRADLVVLDGDLTVDRPPVVRATWIAGQQRYSRPAPPDPSPDRGAR
jgi:predicted amidohydrolase YtcJ